jgi:glycosyltransferase involved in cell wall biosynthesis
VSCLRGAGVDVHEEHVSVWDDVRHGWSVGPAAALRLGVAEARLFARRPSGFDAFVVGYPGHFDLPAARRAARGRPVVFNPLVSLADTLVTDRGRFRPGSLAARALEAIDRHALRSADVVVADTEAHGRFLADLAGLGEVPVCFVGAEERLFTPADVQREPATVLFVGKLIPLHGLETILEAARLAPELEMRIIGSGQMEELMDDLPSNVEWSRWVNYDDLPREYWGAGCALGIFGTSDKALRVIPNKAYQAIASGTPLITGDTVAARELLRDGESALLVPPGDPAALAEAMRQVAADPELAKRLSRGGRAVYEERASEEVLGERWRTLLEELVS